MNDTAGISADGPGDEYTTLRAGTRASLTVRGSRFIAEAYPVAGKGQCAEVLEGRTKEYFDATHHCYAYRLGPRGAEFRAHDDGEPSGSAGKPILAAIDAAALVGVIVVVTRYFGGTKLGTGNLGRAYRGAAEESLASGERLTKVLCDLLTLSFPHSFVGPVMRAVAGAGGRIASPEYGDDVRMEVEIRRSRTLLLRTALIEATGGVIRFTGR